MTSSSEESNSDGTPMGAGPSVVVLYCQRSLASGARPADFPAGAEGLSARLRMLPCSSKVEVWYLLQVLAEGVMGVELVCCPEKACQFLDGNDRASRRVRRAQSLLEEIGVSPERLGLSRGTALTQDDLLERAKNRAEAIGALDSNLTEKAKQV